MTSPKGMDELFRGREFEDEHDWVERLEMVVKVKGIDEHKLFKIGRLNLKGKFKEWYKKLGTTLVDYPAMKSTMILKYGMVDNEEVCVKINQI
jgi:hypothetical protein